MSDMKARVIRVMNETTLIINIGSDDGVNIGDEFSILGTAETIIDPVTNEELGDFYYTKAMLEVIEVQNKYSILAKPQRKATNVFGFPEVNVGSSNDYDYLPINVDPNEFQPLTSQQNMVIHVGDKAELDD